MRRAEKERLQKLYLTWIDVAMKKRSLGYRLLAEAEEEMIAARELLEGGAHGQGKEKG